MDIKAYIFLTTGILGIVCLLKLVFNKNNLVIINNYFIALIAILTIRQFNCLTDLGVYQKISINDLSTSIFNLTLYLSLYLFLNQSINDTNKEIKLKYSKSVVLAVILYLTFNAIMILNNETILNKFLIDFLYTGWISYVNFNLIKKHYLNDKSKANFTVFSADWLGLIVLLFCLTPLKYLLQILSHLIDGNVIVNYKYQLINSIVCIVIFIYLLIHQTSLKEEEKEKENERNEIEKKLNLIWKFKIDQSKLNAKDKEVEKRISNKINYYIDKINNIDKETSILLKKGTTISDLAMELKIPRSHLAFIFKYSEINFVAFKNIIRIEKSKELIENNYLEANTLNSLAEKVGFQSYDPFFKSFKEITTLGPKEYSIINKKDKN